MTQSLEYFETGLARFRTVREMLLAEWSSDSNASTPIETDSSIRTTEYSIGDPSAGIILRRYYCSARPKAVIVWVHGGAFVVGDLDMAEADWVARSLCQSGFEVYSVDYRKVSSDLHFPAPNDDVYSAWKLALAEANALSVPIHLGGASAGGAFAASLVVRLDNLNETLPSSLALVYPVLHPELPEPTEEQRLASAEIPERAVFDEQVIAGMHFMYAGSAENLQNPEAFAGLADLKCFPRTLILNSEHDMLRPSGEKFGQQLAAAGVSVQVKTEIGSRHGQLNEPNNPSGQSSLRRLLSWFEESLPA